MRGTALVVVLCVLAAVSAHVLTEQARARSIAADEMGESGEMQSECAADAADGFLPPPDAPDSNADAAPAPSAAADVAAP